MNIRKIFLFKQQSSVFADKGPGTDGKTKVPSSVCWVIGISFNTDGSWVGIFFKENYFLSDKTNLESSSIAPVSRVTEKMVSKCRSCLQNICCSFLFLKLVEDTAALWSLILFRNIHKVNGLDFVIRIWASVKVGFNREWK